MKIYLDKPAAPPASSNTPWPSIECERMPIVEVRGKAHTVTFANPAFCRLVGKSRETLIRQAFAEIIPVGNEGVSILDRAHRAGEAIAQEDESEADPHRTHWLYAMWPALDAPEQHVGVIIGLTNGPDLLQDAAAINQALLISGLRQHELTAEAVKLNAQLAAEIAGRKTVEAELHAANERLASHTANLEELVALRTQKLRETVSELEAFSYSVAHDMRSPLCGMQGFAHILLEEHSDRLDPEARGYLTHIASSATRMNRLIQDVLNYTWVLRGDAVFTSVDLDRLVRDIVAVDPAWQPPHAEIRIEGKLPRVMGHEGLLTQCVSNLLSNAVKFVPCGVTPSVLIWATGPALPEKRPVGDIERNASGESGHEPMVRLWIGDNGIGIAEKDRPRVFRMFDRINPAPQFEGTGIGLTIVRKAVERMGGRIDFKSEESKGSQFWIELRAPAAPSDLTASAE